MALTLKSFELKPFEFSLIRPLVISGQSLNSRSGFYLHIVDSMGVEGMGELSPLPGLSKESLSQVKAECQGILLELKNVEMKPGKLDFTRTGFNLFPDFFKHHHPSSPVLFALEGALLDWASKKNASLVRDFFQLADDHLHLPINALLIPDLKGPMPEDLVERYLIEGIKTVKVKIGRLPLQKEKIFLKRLLSTCAQHLSWRLDGNRQLSVPDFLELVDGLDLARVEYVEDPLQSLAQWPAVFSTTGLKLALDESLCQVDMKNPLPPGTDALVIKPQVQGGISGSLQLMKEAWSLGLKAVVSGSFESPLGIKFLGLLAHLQNQQKPVSAGLDTISWFSPDSYSSIEHLESALRIKL